MSGSDDGSGKDVELEPAGETMMKMPMDVHDCSFIMAVIPFPAADATAYIPEGYEPVAAQDIGIPQDQRGDALLGIEAERCDRGLMPDGSYAEDVSTGSFWIPIRPSDPADHQFGAEFYIAKLETLVWSQEGYDMLSSMGLTARQGEAVFDEPIPTNALPRPEQPHVGEIAGMNAYTAQLRLDGDETYTYTFGGSATKYFVASPFKDFTCVGFHPTTDGHFIKGGTDFHASVIHESLGMMTVPEGGLPAEIVGAGDHVFYALVGYGSYYNMHLHVHSPDGHAAD
jgi:hypothetical protein